MGAPNIVEEMVTYKINAVEIFSTGKWNNDVYTRDDLYSMVDAFDKLKEGFKPYLKLGHDDKQKIVKSSGLPSIGWVEKIYVSGNKLLADLHNIPDKIYKLIKSKAYRKVSCEIYWNLDVNGIQYPRVLGALALLGCETPGVLNLADILGNYTILANKNAEVFQAMEKQDTFKSYSIDIETNAEDLMSDDKLKEIETELETKKKEYTQLESEKSDLQKKLDAQAEELKKFQLEAEKQANEVKEAKLEKFVVELESKKLVTPAMKPLVKEVMSDKKEYTIDKKQYSKEDLLTEILTLSKEASKVNFVESSKSGDHKVDKDKDTLDMIEKYAKENKCDYAIAAKAVLKQINAANTVKQ